MKKNDVLYLDINFYQPITNKEINITSCNRLNLKKTIITFILDIKKQEVF